MIKKFFGTLYSRWRWCRTARLRFCLAHTAVVVRRGAGKDLYLPSVPINPCILQDEPATPVCSKLTHSQKVQHLKTRSSYVRAHHRRTQPLVVYRPLSRPVYAAAADYIFDMDTIPD